MSITPYRPFTRLTHNVKDVVENLELGPLTAIVGEEATYKSANAIAMRLALTGEYPEIGKNPSDLLSLAANADDGIFIDLGGEDGGWRWTLPVENGKAKRPQPPEAYGQRMHDLTAEERYCILAGASVRDLLKNAKSDKKLRTALLYRFGGGAKDVPCPYPPLEMDENGQLIGEDPFAGERQTWNAAVRAVQDAEPESTADAILASVGEYFKNGALAKNRQIKPLEALCAQKAALIKKQSSGLELLAQYEADLVRKRESQTHASSFAERDKLVLEATEVDCQLLELSARQAREDDVAAKLTANLEGSVERAQKAIDDALAAFKNAVMLAGNAEANYQAFAKRAEQGTRKCPYCPYEHVDIKAVETLRDTFAERIKERGQEVAQAEQAVTSARGTLDAAKSALFAHKQKVQSASSSLAHTKEKLAHEKQQKQARIDELNRVLAGMKANAAPATAQEIEALATKIAGLKEAQRAKADLARDQAKLKLMQKEHEAMKAMEKEAIALQKEVMVRVAQVASDEVSKGMLDGRRAILDPISCDWYIQRLDGQTHGPWGALCGTEKTSLMLGLTSAWTRGSPLRVAIFDDEDLVGLSSKGIRDFYAQLEKLVKTGDFTQVVVVNNRPELVPTNEKWHVILRERRTA